MRDGIGSLALGRRVSCAPRQTAARKPPDHLFEARPPTPRSASFRPASRETSVGVTGLHQAIQFRLVGRDIALRDLIQEALRAGEDESSPDARRAGGAYCGCFSTSTRRAAAVELMLRRLVEVAPELRRTPEAHGIAPDPAGASRPPDALARIWAEPPTRETELPTLMAGPDALMEQIRLEEDLPVGDRDDVGRDVRGQVARLGLDDRQRGKRAAAVARCSASRPARAGGSEDRKRLRETPRVRGGAAAGARSHGRPAHASTGRRRCRPRGGRCRGSTRRACRRSRD